RVPETQADRGTRQEGKKMAQGRHKSVLFLCTGNDYRSRFAEIVFNAVADRMGLLWRASSRGLALERGVNNIGSRDASAVTALEIVGIRATDASARLPAQVTTAELEAVDLIVALKESEHRALLVERFPLWVDRAEYWHIDDAPEVLPAVE